MDGYQFISSLVGSIAWPLAIAVVALIFKKPLQNLLPRIKDFELWGGKATFSEQLKEAEKSGKEILAHSDIKPANVLLAGKKAMDAKKTNEPFYELARHYPEAAVMGSFKMVEAALIDSRFELDLPARVRNREIVQQLVDEGYLPYSAVEFFVSIVGTRNAAVHARGKTITTGEAIAYRELCVQLVELIREALEKRRKAKREPPKPKLAKG